MKISKIRRLTLITAAGFMVAAGSLSGCSSDKVEEKASEATSAAESAVDEAKDAVKDATEKSSSTTTSAAAESDDDDSEEEAKFENVVSAEEVVKDLKNGGYVIFIRHGHTAKDYADQADPNMKLDDCSTQRQLDDLGKKQAKEIGEAFKKLEIPVGDVVSSEYCRAYNTAELAFGHYEKNSKLNFEPAEDFTDEQIETMKNNITPMLETVPAEGMNNVIVGHDDVFDAATGIYPEPQGTTYIVKPEGDSFEVITRITAEEWPKLAM
ncbi:histidine phosphatase family protein [Corynebacterium sp. P7202]|uniref:Histidine phosphatase family protein n=1 Tax=Corynebacterium pygosceleis TaxID=2800406 RepID=A0A9Q4C8T7_9CORY|nr:histidine phosphatase family protein [Corynebacterium pygosceleis]MCK7637833.1 histidine phosphatase family protein [Corynebacterium pygosceleis]MCX7444627.1 histidine phosphatase family protein [Corynebacterium pygosceleis]MCX7468549.1 histidine phosphatase family protein [Corynebacterium pygosceleis]